ncbi:hypothetical protein LJK88_44605 [Paenibacillus sp. P26]|nr:hypothetical protein LJK88_44605 [Paenibacillus sp. P26]
MENRTAAGSPQAVNGVLDLTGWNFAGNGIVRLDGQWEYYRNQLLTPDDFGPQRHGGKPPELTGFVHVPDSWEHYAVDGRKESPYGYATFRLHVKLPEGHGQTYGIRQINIKTSHKLFVNGREIGARGVPGTTKQETISVNAPSARFFRWMAPKRISFCRSLTFDIIKEESRTLFFWAPRKTSNPCESLQWRKMYWPRPASC